MTVSRTLKEADLFKGIRAKQMERLGKVFEERSFQQGETIFHQGEPAHSLYILLEGEVSMGVRAKGEVDLTAYSVGRKGEPFGLSSLVRPYRNNVSAVCVKKSRALVASGETCRKLIKQHPRIGMMIMERVAEIYFNRLNSTRAMITNLFKMFKFQTGKTKLMETYYET